MAMDEAAELAAALPGYEIGGELGEGAFGVVLVGRHRQLGRQVAIKRLPRSFSDHAEVRHRFSAEAKVLASLDHPHIVPIFDYVEHEGLCVLVMELLPGGTVRQWQASGLSAQAACAIALATCSALDYGHQRGVLHRDVKPDNLLFTSAGLLKVTDFGIAKVVGDVAVTRIGETPGTPMYMAPEQCLDQPLTPSTDVYATGLMLYELLAGGHPFAGSHDVVSTMYRQVHEQPPPLQAANPAIPDLLATAVMRALAKEPSARYRSARAFGGALAEAAATSWRGAWPAGDALRIMSVGPIEAATGWPLTSGPVAMVFPPREETIPAPGGTAHLFRESVAASARGPEALPWSEPGAVPPVLQPTLLRAAPHRDPGGYPAEVDLGSGSPPPPPPRSVAPWEAADPVPTQVLLKHQPTGVNSPPPRPGSGHRGRAVALLGVLLAGVVAAILLVVLRPSRGTPTAGSSTTLPPHGNATQVAGDVNRLIQESAAARTQVVNTVASIQNCSANLQIAATALASAVTSRQQVVGQLGRLPVEMLPNGVAMRLAMTNALNDSIDADHHFQSWLAGVTASGGCTGGQAPHDGNWQAAQASSAAATGAKQTFAALWNPIAATYALPHVTSGTI